MSPKITVHGGASNARDADVSPAADASQPQVAAEGDLGPQLPVKEPVADEPAPADDAEPVAAEDDPGYEGMSLAELKDAATARELPTYGTKAQLVERLREADASEDAE
jgi:hypothetical protein